MRRIVRPHRFRALRTPRGGSIHIAGRSTASAPALATDIFDNALIAAFFEHRSRFCGRDCLKNLAAARFIDLLVMRVAIAVGDAFRSDALAMTGHADVAAFARVLDLGHFRNHRNEATNLSDVIAAAMRAAAAILRPSAIGEQRGQDNDGE